MDELTRIRYLDETAERFAPYMRERPRIRDTDEEIIQRRVALCGGTPAVVRYPITAGDVAIDRLLTAIREWQG